MMIFKRICTVGCCLLTVGTAAFGQTEVTTSYQIGLGNTGILDTYLSQEKFSGLGLTLLSTNERRQTDSQWSTMLQHQLNATSAEDRAKTVNELQGDYTLLVGRYRAWQFSRLTLQAGAAAAFNLGFIYNTSNSNNPAQGRVALNIMPSAIANYRLPIGGRPWYLRYELELPFVGIMFSPNFGQSYYEIFSRGDYDHNIVPTTFVATPSLRHMLSVDYGLNRSLTLRLSYLGDYQQAKVNNLKSHIYHHRVMIGVVRNFTICSHP